MAQPNEPWTTTYPAGQDTDGVEQPNLTNDSYPGAEDGHRFLVEHVHALRDKLQSACLKIGDTSGNPTPTSLEYRVQQLEAGGGGGAPSGPAGPDYLGGTYPNPEVIAVKESGGQKLTIGSVADTEYLIRSGTDIVSTDPSHFSDTANPHSVTKTQVSLGNVEDLKVNLTATTAPGAGADSSAGYAVGSRWIDVSGGSEKEYVCLRATPGSVVWTETTGAAGSTDTHVLNEEQATTTGGETKDSDLNTVLTNTPLTSTNSLSGFALEAYRNGRKMGYTATPSDYDDYYYNNSLNRIEYKAAAEADTYEFVYFSVLGGGGGEVDPNAIHTNENGEIYGLNPRGTPDGTDVFVVEADVGGNWVKRKLPFSSVGGGGGTDVDAIHKSVAEEIHLLDDEPTGIDAASEIVYESATVGENWAKKRGAFSALPVTDSNAVHINVDDEYDTATFQVGALNGDDRILIEEATSGNWEKRYVNASSIPSGTDSAAIHENVNNEMQAAITAVTDTELDDIFLLEESTTTNWEKRVISANNLLRVENRIVTVDDPGGSYKGKYTTLNAAVTALNGVYGGTIIMKAGTYSITSPITVSSAIKIVSVDGPAVISNNSGGYALTFDVNASNSGLENIKIIAGTSEYSLSLGTLSAFSVKRCYIDGYVNLNGCLQTSFEDCYIHNTGTGTSSAVIIQGTAPQVKFTNCNIAFSRSSGFAVLVNSTAGTTNVGHVALDNCNIASQSTCGGVQISQGQQVELSNCYFYGTANRTSYAFLYSTDADCFLAVRNCRMKSADSGTFSGALVEIATTGGSGATIVDGLHADLNNATMAHSIPGTPPLFFKGSNINVSKLIVENVKLPTTGTNSAQFVVVEAFPINVSSPAQEGAIAFRDCIFRKITVAVGTGSLDASIFGLNSQSGANGNLYVTNCFFDGRQVDHAHSGNRGSMIKYNGSPADLSSLQVRDCYFTGGTFYAAIETSDMATLIQGCQFMFRDSNTDDIYNIMRIAGYAGGQTRASFCDVSNNFIQRPALGGDTMLVRYFDTVFVSNNSCSATGDDSDAWDLYLDNCSFTTITGNKLEGKIQVTAGNIHTTVHGNIAGGYLFGGSTIPATFSDNNVIF